MWIRFSTLLALGILNLFRVAWFRFGVRFGWSPVRRLRAEPPKGPFFAMPEAPAVNLPVPDAWWHDAPYFGHRMAPVDEASPNWNASPFTSAAVSQPERPWWQIPDFDSAVGDIKVVWEASRFDWLVTFAQRAAVGDAAALVRLNHWLEDWCLHNPPYSGPNWKCGQEASIRVMHLLLAAHILKQTGCGTTLQRRPSVMLRVRSGATGVAVSRPDPATSLRSAQDDGVPLCSAQDGGGGRQDDGGGARDDEGACQKPGGSRSPLVQLVATHLQRILPTLSYAMAQDNNHGTSEAAALFMGGAWLTRLGHPEGARYRKAGRKWLENRARRLIMPDGTFSQYSVNYHRVMLDTYSWAEQWRRLMDEPRFSDALYHRLQLATDWLANMVAASSGDVPNVGANDGARLIQLTDTDYRDYRPSVQLATVLFHGAAAYAEEGVHDLPLVWLGLGKPSTVHDARAARDYPDGGFAVLRQGNAMALLRYPVFRFRPSQSDLLHVDLWCGDTNVLRDAGTYSYNSGDEFQDYFGSTVAHNTVQFDGRDQMPKLSRFLYGAWPRTRRKITVHEKEGRLCCAAAYRDWQGAEHQRELRLSDASLMVVDNVAGFHETATLRWRLCPGEWRLEGDRAISEHGSIAVTADSARIELRLTEGWESRYYSEKTPLPVLEVTVREPCTITSEMDFPS